jgi:hypothetical protein
VKQCLTPLNVLLVERQFKSGIISVELRKSDPNSGLGFGIVRDLSTTPSLLRIAQIIPDGIVDRDGRLQTGDRLVQVTIINRLCCGFCTHLKPHQFDVLKSV